MWWILLRKDVNAITWLISLRGFYSKFLYFHFHIFWTSAQFLLEHGHHETDSIMRGKAAVAFHNGNYKELYSIMEGRYISVKKLVSWILYFVDCSCILLGDSAECLATTTSPALQQICTGRLTLATTQSCRTCGTRRITRKPRRLGPGLLVSTKFLANFLDDMWDVYNARKGSGWKTSCCLLQV